MNLEPPADAWERLPAATRTAITDAIVQCLNTGEATIPSKHLRPAMAATFLPAALAAMQLTEREIEVDASGPEVVLRRRRR